LGLIPAPVKPLRGHAKLDNEVPRKVLWLGFTCELTK
jgi:hypothetical protein